MSKSLYSLSNTDLAEVLDASGRPVCLLSQADIIAQGLPHRQVAMLATAETTQMLLAEIPGPQFDVTAHMLQPAGWSLQETALRLLRESTGQTAPITKAAVFGDGVTTTYVYKAQFSEAMLSSIASPSFLLTDMREIPALDGQNLLSDFLLKILARLKF